MYYTIYRIINKINDKVYIGKHKTINLDDGYMGSGKLIKRAITKYGIDNFEKEYICFCDDENQMNLIEKNLVNHCHVANNMTYNLKLGGVGGFDYINNNKLTYCYTNPILHKKNSKQNIKNANSILHEKLKANSEFSDIRKKKIGETSKGRKPFLNKKHTDEAKRKIGIANSEKQKGRNNSQYGTCWITDGEINKKIPKDDLDKWIENGYYKGRI